MKIAGSRKSGREVRFGGAGAGNGSQALAGKLECLFPWTWHSWAVNEWGNPAQQPQGTWNPSQALQSTSFTLHFAGSTLSTQKRRKLWHSLFVSLSLNPHTVLEQGANQAGERWRGDTDRRLRFTLHRKWILQIPKISGRNGGLLGQQWQKQIEEYKADPITWKIHPQYSLRVI